MFIVRSVLGRFCFSQIQTNAVKTFQLFLAIACFRREIGEWNSAHLAYFFTHYFTLF